MGHVGSRLFHNIQLVSSPLFSLQDTYEHSRENTGVFGVFDPTGHGSCYYQQTGKLRY